MMSIKVGCCGFPERREKYFQEFKLVEIQQTFYKPPFLETVKRWRGKAPEDFEFSLKAWQLITHLPSSPTYRKGGLQIPADKESNYGFFKPSEEVFEAWTKTRDIVQVLKAKVIVFQCPASFVETAENIENMTRFFTSVDRGDFIFVWEPRGKWNDDVIMALCQDLDLIHCVDALERRPLHGETRYFRLHGGRNYRHQYTDDELTKLLQVAGDEAYILFNNITMHSDALRFIELAKAR